MNCEISDACSCPDMTILFRGRLFYTMHYVEDVRYPLAESPKLDPEGAGERRARKRAQVGTASILSDRPAPVTSNWFTPDVNGRE